MAHFLYMAAISICLLMFFLAPFKVVGYTSMKDFMAAFEMIFESVSWHCRTLIVINLLYLNNK